MVSDSAYNKFIHGLDYDGLKSTIVECATKIYIAQMQLEKEKLQEEYDELYEGHDKLSYDWAQLKKENRELNKKYNELLEDFNRINSEPLLRKMTIAEGKGIFKK
nr:MAG TPA: Homeobox associated leucine zipper [Caudoviricetes sp.]